MIDGYSWESPNSEFTHLRHFDMEEWWRMSTMSQSSCVARRSSAVAVAALAWCSCSRQKESLPRFRVISDSLAATLQVQVMLKGICRLLDQRLFTLELRHRCHYHDEIRSFSTLHIYCIMEFDLFMILIKQKTRKMRFFGLHKCMRWLRRVPLCADLTVRGLGVPGLAEGDAMIATWLRTMETMDTMHTMDIMDTKTKPRQSIFFWQFFFSNPELLSQCFSACFCHCCASEGPTPNRITWPISHWLFVAGKSWKGVLAISSASTGCLGRILKWRRRMSDWNSV